MYALLRNSWRQLTSMRTALVLLFLLAIAAIPGSVLPQRSVNQEQVGRYFAQHPTAAPILDRLWAFDVFSSPWFSAIYVLLFISLIGCLVPRLRDHIRALRAKPPAAPKRLERLPHHATVETDLDARAIAACLARWRVTVRGNEVSAERGYLKETGNLLFHFALLAVLLGVAIGSWYGWHANRLLVAGPDKAFCTSLQQFDDYGLGARVSPGDLPPFCLELTDFQATYTAAGQPLTYRATAIKSTVDGTATPISFSVNDPLRADPANVYLLGHGYAPILRYTDRTGHAQTTIAPFLPVDEALTSEGVAMFPDANGGDPELQVAFDGLYLPTAPDRPPYIRSVHPAEQAPAVMLFPYRGNLGLDAGIPQSVYQLNRRQLDNGRLKPVGEGKLLRVGESLTLDDGTKLEFVGTRQWVTLTIRHDPGQPVVLVGVGLLLVGLLASITGRRRRIWFRVTESTSGGPHTVEAGGLTRSEYTGFADEFAGLVDQLRAPERVKDVSTV